MASNRKGFKAKFTGICSGCGEVVLGWKGGSKTVNGVHHGTVSYASSHYYQWRKRDSSGNPVSGLIMHVDPSCEEVKAGELLPSDMRDGTAPTVPPPAELKPPPTRWPSSSSRFPTRTARPVAVPTVGPSVSDPVDYVDYTPGPASMVDPEPVETVALPTGKRKLTGAATWDQLLPILLEAGVKRIGITGPAGTGKSTTAQKIAEAVAKSTGRKVYRITLTENMTKEELIGSFQLLKEDGVTVQKFVPGPAVLALQEGAVLQCDEYTHLGPDVESLMYALWDDQPQILLADGTYIDHAAEGYACIGTTNDAPEQLAPPLLDRCEAFLLATTPHPAALMGCTAEEISVCQNYYRGLDTKPWKFSRSPSVRMVRAFSRLRKTGLLSDELLAKSIFGEAASEFLSALSSAGLAMRMSRR